MTLRFKLGAYLILLHGVLAGVLVWQREVLGWWLFPLELVLVLSLVLGWRWIRTAHMPHAITRTLPDIVESGEYGSRYPLAGHREVDRVIGAYNDMLANLQRERLRLGERRGFLEHFLAVTPVGIVIFDFDGRVSLANPRAAQLLGTQTGELTGQSLAGIDSPLAKVLTSLEDGEVRLVSDESGRRLRCQRSQFIDRSFSRTFLLIEELTAELNRSERNTYEKLIRMMSHEVTNTVAATNSLLESFRSYAAEFSGDEHRSDFVNALNVLIERNSNLNDFTQGFSNLVKLPEPQLEATALLPVIEPLRTMFRADLQRRDIRFVLDLDDSLPEIPMDRGQIEQVLINVIKNAAEAIDTHGVVEIFGRRVDAGIDLAVFDSGPGFDNEAGAALFTPFYTTKKHGQGLGLMLVREVLSRHGFAWSLERCGSRTRFRILMPVPRS